MCAYDGDDLSYINILLFYLETSKAAKYLGWQSGWPVVGSDLAPVTLCPAAFGVKEAAPHPGWRRCCHGVLICRDHLFVSFHSPPSSAASRAFTLSSAGSQEIHRPFLSRNQNPTGAGRTGTSPPGECIDGHHLVDNTEQTPVARGVVS